MSGRRVVVTGAAGRLGGKIAAALRASGRFVVGIDRAPRPSAASWDEYVQCDLSRACDGDARATLRAALVGADEVVHCAAWPGPSATGPPALDPAVAALAARSIGLEACAPAAVLVDNVAMTTALCDAAVEAGARRFVFSSSAFAMGWSHAATGAQALTPRYLPMDEAHPCAPLESYGLSKLLCEQVLETAARTARDVSFVSLRFTNVIKAEAWAALPWPPPDAARPLPLVFWAYAHEDDVVRAHVDALDAPDAAAPGAHEAYLLAAPETRFALPTRTLLADYAGLAAVDERAPLDGIASILCSRKARARLGWRPRSWAAEAAAAAGAAAPALARAEQRGGVAAVAARADPHLRTLDLGGFALERGGALPAGAAIAFRMYGAPPDAARGRGLILHPTSFDAVHPELEYRIGPGRALDTARHAVLVVNLLGNGVSHSPSTAGAGGGAALVTIGDNVRAQAAVLDHLGLDVRARPLELVFGYSMGGLQAFEWAVRYPHAAKAIAVVCGGARAAPVNRVFLRSLQAALTADERWDPARRAFRAHPAAGLCAFARIYAGWGVGADWFERRLFADEAAGGTAGASVEAWVAESYEAAFARSDADDLLAQTETWLHADVAAAADGGDLARALAKVRARVLLMPCESDRYFTLEAARAEAALLGERAVLRPIASAAGHRAGDPHRRGLERENAFIAAQVAALLDGTL